MPDLTTTNVWLGILAIVSVVQFLMIATAVFLAYRFYRRGMAVLETVERVHIAPLRARVEGVVDEAQRMIDTLKHAQDSVSGLAGAVRARTWPITGILQGLRTAAATVMRDGRKDRDSAYGSM